MYRVVLVIIMSYVNENTAGVVRQTAQTLFNSGVSFRIAGVVYPIGVPTEGREVIDIVPGPDGIVNFGPVAREVVKSHYRKTGELPSSLGPYIVG